MYIQTTGNDFVTIKYLPTGSQDWVTTYPGIITNGFDIATDLLIDTSLNVFVTGASTGLISSGVSVVIKYSQPVGISSSNNQLPQKDVLSRNYPNPFNPKTNIKYQLSKRSYVSLIIYDILGKQTEVLVKQNLKPGTYEVNWNGSNYSSGMYFYRLITDEYSETKKMIMVK